MPCVGMMLMVHGWNLGNNMLKYQTTSHFERACSRGLDLMSVSSLCLIHSDSLHGFCHFHLNCTSHWWWLLFHLHSFPDCPTTANFFIDNCPMGTICTHSKPTFLVLDKMGINIQILQLKEQDINLSCLIYECCWFPDRAISNSCCIF